MKPKISIIVPVYKAEQYIHKCIDSILAQTFLDFEVILIDDGSPDNSGKICDEYASKDSRIRVLHKANEGVSSARNDGIAISKGEYIMFVDSDDWIESNALEILMLQNSNNKCDVVIFGLTKDFFFNSELIRSEFNGYYKKHEINIGELSDNFIYFLNSVGMLSSWMYLFKSKIIHDNKIFFNKNLVLYEDFDFNLRYLENCKSISFLPDALYHYNIYTTVNLLAKRNKINIVSDISTVSRSLIRFLTKTGTTEKEMKKTYYYILPMFTLCLRNIIIHKNNTNLRTKFEVLKQLNEDDVFRTVFSEISSSMKFYRLLKIFMDQKLYLLAYLIVLYKFNK